MRHCYILDYNTADIYHTELPDILITNEEIESYLSNNLGFKLSNILDPDYRYTNGHGERLHKFGFRKQKLLKRYPRSGLTKDMTEKQMTEKLGFYRIWDCGLIKYVYIN